MAEKDFRQLKGPDKAAILMLALRAYERGEGEMSLQPVEAWIAPYRVVRL